MMAEEGDCHSSAALSTYLEDLANVSLQLRTSYGTANQHPGYKLTEGSDQYNMHIISNPASENPRVNDGINVNIHHIRCYNPACINQSTNHQPSNVTQQPEISNSASGNQSTNDEPTYIMTSNPSNVIQSTNAETSNVTPLERDYINTNINEGSTDHRTSHIYSIASIAQLIDNGNSNVTHQHSANIGINVTRDSSDRNEILHQLPDHIEGSTTSSCSSSASNGVSSCITSVLTASFSYESPRIATSTDGSDQIDSNPNPANANMELTADQSTMDSFIRLCSTPKRSVHKESTCPPPAPRKTRKLLSMAMDADHSDKQNMISDHQYHHRRIPFFVPSDLHSLPESIRALFC